MAKFPGYTATFSLARSSGCLRTSDTEHKERLQTRPCVTQAKRLTYTSLKLIPIILTMVVATVSANVIAAPQENAAETRANDDKGINSPKTFSISGICLDEDKDPIAKVKVELYRTDRPDAALKETHTDVDGRYVFKDVIVPPIQEEVHMSYVCVLTSPGRASHFVYVRSLDKEDIQKATMRPAATLTGRVTNPEGKPIAGASVWTIGVGQQMPLKGVFSAMTDDDGQYAITDLEPFDVVTAKPIPAGNGVTFEMSGKTLKISHPDYARQVPLFMRAPGTFDVVMEYGGTLEGQVIDAVTGKPAANVSVNIRSTQRGKGENWREVRTDAEGHYRAAALGEAVYAIWAQVDARTCVAIESISVEANQTNQVPELKLIEGAWIEGKVVGQDALPIAHDPKTGRRIRIEFKGPSHPQQAPGTEWCAVEDDGRFRIRVAPGRNFIKIFSVDLWKRTARRAEFEKGIEIEEGETHKLFFRILPE